MKISFLGAVRTVTGSRHLLTVGNRRVLLDCGLYQGKRDLGERINRELPFDPASIDAVVLSHAHIDHSGNLPTLARQGFRGPIHATEATASMGSALTEMCWAGRVLHHLRNNIEDPRVVVLIVGFQAEDTLGRRLAEGRPTVRIFGEEFERRAEVAVMEGFSAHADRDELLGWAARIQDRPRRTFVVHGGIDQGEALAGALRDRGFRTVEIPEVGQEVAL